MSTRAAIGYADNGMIRTIYSHYDGYPSHVGRLLREHYGSFAAAKQLTEGNQIRQFNQDGTIERFNDGPSGFELADSIKDAIEGFDYLYLCDEAGQWTCYGRIYPSRDVVRIDIPTKAE